jgi:hypothetical protein
MTIIKACGGALLAATVGFVLSELGFRGKRAVSAISMVIFLLCFVDLLADAISKIALVQIADEGREALQSALKIVGVGHAFNISADTCSELSEGGISTVLSLIGKVQIILMILPIAIDLIEYSASIFI